MYRGEGLEFFLLEVQTSPILVDMRIGLAYFVSKESNLWKKEKSGLYIQSSKAI